jgi:hypothetical protein
MWRGWIAAKLTIVKPIAHPTVEIVVDGSRSDGSYAVLDIWLPADLVIGRHLLHGPIGIVQLLDGALELRTDDAPAVVARPGLVPLPECRPITIRVLEAARLVAVLVPAGAAKLLPAVANPLALPDDRAALLAAAGIRTLPSLSR